MTQFDLEMKIFKEIVNKYTPVAGFNLVLDLTDYKNGTESIREFKIGCETYPNYINVECPDKNIETVLITSIEGKRLTYRSKYLYAKYCYDTHDLIEIEDLTPRNQFLKRSIQQEMELLCYELQNPQPVKPDC